MDGNWYILYTSHLKFKMFIRTLWYFLNIVFCIYNVNNVVRNRLTTLVEYRKDWLEEDYLSVCLSISAGRLACEKARSEAALLTGLLQTEGVVRLH